MELRVAGAQIEVTTDVDANLAAIERGIDFAVAEQADILLTPEGSLSGYTHQFDVDRVAACLERITARARAAKLGLALGTCFVESDGICYNQIRFYAPDGAFLGFHSKTLCCGTMEEPPRGEVNHYGVKPLRTFEFNGITIGGLVCNDLWATPACTPMPDTHLTQQLANAGAKIIFHAVNGGRSGGEWSEVGWRYHEANLRIRARSGGVWIVTVDNCHPTSLRCSAPSGVVAPDGSWACRAEPTGTQHFAHTLHIS